MTVRFDWRSSLLNNDFPAEAYEKLRDGIEHSTPFNRLGWLRGCERAMSEGQNLHVLLGWQEQRLVLCLPLIYCRERKAGLPIKVIRHLGFPLSDRLALLVANDALDVMPQALSEIRQHLPHTLLQLSELIQAELALKTWQANSWYSEHSISCRAPEHLIVETDKEEPRGNLRYELRRARKRCAEAEAHVVRIVPDAQNIDSVISTISEVEQASWKGEDQLGIFSGESRQRWMRAALRGLVEEGCVRVIQLEHQGRCVSYRLGLLESGRLYDYNIAFLPDHSHLGSGRLLLDEWIRWGLDDDWQWVDASRVSLSRSNHQLHERMSGQVEHVRWSFYSRRPSGFALGLADRVWQAVKPRLKQWRKNHAKNTTRANQS